MLHADLPKTICRYPGGVQRVSSPGAAAVEELETSAQQPAQGEAEAREECAGKDVVEEADAAPACADGAGDGGCGAEDLRGEAVEGGDGVFGELPVAEEREGGVVEGEEAAELGEGEEVLAEVGEEAGGVGGVDERAGEGGDQGGGARGDGGDCWVDADGEVGTGRGRGVEDG